MEPRTGTHAGAGVMEHEQDIRPGITYTWVKDGDKYNLVEYGASRRGTFTSPDPPDLTGEDEGVDMRDQPMRDHLDLLEETVGLMHEFNRDMVGILKDWSAQSRAAESASDQPDRAGSEGAD